MKVLHCVVTSRYKARCTATKYLRTVHIADGVYYELHSYPAKTYSPSFSTVLHTASLCFHSNQSMRPRLPQNVQPHPFLVLMRRTASPFLCYTSCWAGDPFPGRPSCLITWTRHLSEVPLLPILTVTRWHLRSVSSMLTPAQVMVVAFRYAKLTGVVLFKVPQGPC